MFSQISSVARWMIIFATIAAILLLLPLSGQTSLDATSNLAYVSLPSQPSAAIVLDFETGTEGWSNSTNPGEQAIHEVSQSSEQAYHGNYSLRLWTHLDGSDDNLRSGVAWVMIPGNLAERSITAWVICGQDLAGRPCGGDRSRPNGFQLFVKDQQWRSQSGPWYSIGPDRVNYQVREGEWTQITMTPTTSPPEDYYTDPGFNPTKIIVVGIKFGVGGGSTAVFDGAAFLDFVNLSVAPLSTPGSDYFFDFNNLPPDLYPLPPDPPFKYRPYWDACRDFNADAWGSEDISLVPRGPGDKALAINARFDLSNPFNSQKGCIGVAMLPNADINNKQHRVIRAEVRFDPSPAPEDLVASILVYDRQDSRPNDVWYKRVDVPVGGTNWSEIVFDLDDLTQRSPSTPESPYVQDPIQPGVHVKNILFVNLQFFANTPYTGTIYLDNVTIGGHEKDNFQNCNQGFVKANGPDFVLNGAPYRFGGANTYYLFSKSHFMIDDVMAVYQANNLRVLRTWGFSDGTAPYAQDSTPGIGDGNEGNAFQPEPGMYFEPTFVNFDYVIKSAGEHCIRLVIPLVNHWSDKDIGTGQNQFGGMGQYVEWCDIAEYDDMGRITNKNLFYTDPCAKQLYKNYIAYMLNRVNSLTGIRYKDDPTILAWELANEPRCQASDGCPGDAAVYAWAAEMSDYIRNTLQVQQLVALGDEGFFKEPGNPDSFYNGAFGVDWERNLSIETIDFGTVHLYPDLWNKDLAWAEAWIKNHIDRANVIGKPVVFDEYGRHVSKGDRDAVYASWWCLFECYQEGADGDLVWMVAGKQDDGSDFPDFDGFTIWDSSSTMQGLREHATRMHLFCPDCDGNRNVDVVDIMKGASRWGTSCADPDPDHNPATPNYDSRYDLDSDCDIDATDVTMVATHWRAARPHANMVIYDDTLASGWSDRSWSANADYQSTDYVHSGVYAISVQLGPWGGLAFGHEAPILVTPCDQLEFWINGGSDGGQLLRVSVNLDWGDHERPPGGLSINDASYIENGTVGSNMWKLVSVPLADLQLGVGGTSIVKINIMDNSGTTQPRFYIDDARLVGGP